jgi:multiple sugar transport system substrate-binding protein
LDLTDYFEVSDVFKADDILPVNDYYIVRGRRYGFVKDWSPDYSIFIRKDYFEEAGITPPTPDEPVAFDTWREWSGKLMKREGDRILRWGTGWALLKNPILYQPTTFDPPGDVWNDDLSELQILDNPKLLEVAKFMFDWKKEGTFPSALNPFIGGWAGPDFRDGQSASVAYGYWYTGFVMDAAWDLNENIVMLPAPAWGPTYSNPCAAGTGGAVSSTTKYPDAAWTLFQYFFGEEPAENRARIGWGVPGLEHLLDLMPKDEPWRKQALDMVRWEMENSTLFKVESSPYVNIDVINAAWGKYEESALKGDMAFEEMMEKVEQDVNQAIKEGMERAGL